MPTTRTTTRTTARRLRIPRSAAAAARLRLRPRRTFSSSSSAGAASASAPPLVVLPPLLLTALILAAVSSVAEASLAMVVASGAEECFVIRAPGKETSSISGNFDCLDDGLDPDPVRVTLYDATGRRVWQSDDGASEGTFSLSGVGRHLLCVANGHDVLAGQDDEVDSGDAADGLDRTVGFSVRVRPPSRGRELDFEDPDEEEGPDTRRATRLVEAADDLLDEFEDLRDHQEYLKLREAAHRELSEQTFTRVVRWTVVEALVLAAVAGGQVMYLKKFFEQKRFL